MSYTQYWSIFNHWYIAYTLLYIRHSPCTCRIHGIGPYSTGDTYPVHFYASDIHPVHVVYAVGHIQPVIHSLYTFIHQTFTLYMSYTYHIQPVIHKLCTFIHQTYTLYMSYTRYWAIFNRWYIAYTLLYIRHSPYTCRIHGILQPVIHSLYTFKHQTYTLYMSYTRYWAIFNRWYMACTLLYIRYTSCTCRLCGIGPYTNGDTWPVHINTSDIHPVHVVYAVLIHIQPVIHELYTFIHQTYTLYMS